MKHVYMKYEWNNCWQFPKKEGIWHREKETVTQKGRKETDVLISMCTLGGYVLSLSLFCTHDCSEKKFDEFLTGKSRKSPPMKWGYQFSVNTRKGEILYNGELQSNLYLDTRDINEAEKIAEFVWDCMEFKNDKEKIY